RRPDELPHRAAALMAEHSGVKYRYPQEPDHVPPTWMKQAGITLAEIDAYAEDERRNATRAGRVA
ncbi:MAG TPA: hypothetical protein VN108_00945, partial [Marmoricola sp.]|nr:hypothetical protein [Marmoricola sp.]